MRREDLGGPVAWVGEALRGTSVAQPGDRPDIDDSRTTREREVLERIERARRRKARLRDERITMAHGAGGQATQTLIDAVFLEAFRNPLLAPLEDQAVFTVDGRRVAFTTDSFVVSPLFFPGGDIGDLAVNGTVNDLAVSGARPLYLSAGFILEEGFATADLQRIVSSMARAAAAAGVIIATGDTKVVQRGKGDGCYINTAGVGVIERDVTLGAATARPGDAVLVSGPIGEHGITIMLARGELDIASDIVSDTAPLAGLVGALLDAVRGVRCLRDATRGGVATVLNEIVKASQVAAIIDERAIPVRSEVRGACEMLGIDPLYVACEGRMVVVVDAADAGAALQALRAHPLGKDAALIGTVGPDPAGLVLLKTQFGGTRIVDVLVGDPLPQDLLTDGAVHELGIVQQVVEIVTEASGGAKVRRIVLEIGKLTTVLPDAVRFCFDLATEDTVAEGALLEIVETSGRARCRACAAEFALEQPFGRCGCGGTDLEWLAGEELRIKELEVA